MANLPLLRMILAIFQNILPHFINKTKFDRFIDPFASINLPETWNLAQQISSNGTGEGSELYEQYSPSRSR